MAVQGNMLHLVPMRCLIALLALLVVPLAATAADKPARPPVALPTTQKWLGDLPDMLQRRTFRLLVPYSKTQFNVHLGQEVGVAAVFGREYERWLNARHRKGKLPVRLVFVPLSWDQLMPALLDGRGDAIAGNLTVTPERQELIAFAPPWLRNVDEVLVTGPAAPRLAGLDDLAGREVHVRRTSSYHTHLLQVNAGLAQRGLQPIAIRMISERLQDEDILHMVSAGLLPWAFVDNHLATLWAGVLPGLVQRDDIAINRHGEIAWAHRRNSPELAADLAAFFASRRDDTLFGATVRNRYYRNPGTLKNAGAGKAAARFDTLIGMFQQHAAPLGFDHLMIAAQGYQESQLDQAARSHRGAIGIMQLMPATAAAPPIGIPDIAASASRNIEAGARYMAHLREKYVNDPDLGEVDRTLMTFAAYNAGPGNLRKFRRDAARRGLDPNIWFNNVEQSAARIVGRETVQYVGNIYKYYVAYQLAMQRRDEAAALWGANGQ